MMDCIAPQQTYSRPTPATQQSQLRWQNDWWRHCTGTTQSEIDTRL